MYQIIGADGREYGPLTAEQIRAWATEDRIRPETMVKMESDQHWKPVSTFPEFANLWPQVGTQNRPAVVSDISEDELRLFVGDKNQHYYLSKWQVIAATGGKVSWNWAAFFGEIIWTAYRKMYLYTFVILAVMAATGLLEAGLGLSNIFCCGMSILESVVFGMFGNYLYLTHARRKIAEVKLAYQDQNLQCEQLAQIGGINRRVILWLSIPLILLLVTAIVLLIVIAIKIALVK